jgi:VIT1/CCC1 family predicted Fe2+/Mn2+ transporter
MAEKRDIDPAIKEAVLLAISTCAEIAADEEHGELGKTIANKIRGLAIHQEDELVANYMMRDGLSEAEAREIADAVRGVFEA